MKNIQAIVTNLKKKGISSNENWLSSDEISKIKKIVLKLKKSKGDKRSHLPINNLSIVLKVLKLQFIDIFLGLYLKKLSKKLRLKKISNDFFEGESELVNIDFYLSKKSEMPVLDWHVDKAYAGKKEVKDLVRADDFGLKFIFYLTDVTDDNGCLKYVPSSNKIAYALKKAIYNKEINYSPYWNVNDFQKLVNQNKEKIRKYIDQKKIDEFFEKLKILKDKKNIKRFSHELEKGGAVIFDESGIHKGTEPRYNDRLIFRYIYKKKLKHA
tara:strand:+ start:2847 stop:3653 length:807 start_codon:yes stop_codon:yes gene_type:complete